MSHNHRSSWKWPFIFILFGFFVIIFLIKHLGKILDFIENWGDGWEDEYMDMAKEYTEAAAPVVNSVKAVKAAVSAKPKAKPVVKKATVDFGLSDRQESIYQLVRREGEIDMKSVLSKVDGVSDRTLRRDMTKMEKLGLIKQVGKTRNSVYKLKE